MKKRPNLVHKNYTYYVWPSDITFTEILTSENQNETHTKLYADKNHYEFSLQDDIDDLLFHTLYIKIYSSFVKKFIEHSTYFIIEWIGITIKWIPQKNIPKQQCFELELRKSTMFLFIKAKYTYSE